MSTYSVYLTIDYTDPTKQRAACADEETFDNLIDAYAYAIQLASNARAPYKHVVSYNDVEAAVDEGQTPVMVNYYVAGDVAVMHVYINLE
jgi:hypothetical protein